MQRIWGPLFGAYSHLINSTTHFSSAGADVAARTVPNRPLQPVFAKPAASSISPQGLGRQLEAHGAAVPLSGCERLGGLRNGWRSGGSPMGPAKRRLRHGAVNRASRELGRTTLERIHLPNVRTRYDWSPSPNIRKGFQKKNCSDPSIIHRLRQLPVPRSRNRSWFPIWGRYSS